jgi:hypothetical protein
MPTYLSRAIASDGEDSLSGTSVVYIAWRLNVVDPLVRVLDPGNPDHVLRAGWLALEDSLDPFGFGTEHYFEPPIFLNFLRGLWTPDPSTGGGGALTRVASRIRWHLEGSTAGNLFVFGL